MTTGSDGTVGPQAVDDPILGAPEPSSGRRASGIVSVALAGLVVGLLGLLAVSPARFGLVVFLSAVAVLGVVLGLRSPVLACVYLLAATFFRRAIPSVLPVDPFILAFVGVLASTYVWSTHGRRDPAQAARIDPLVCSIALYLTWNVISMVLPHPYPPGSPLDLRQFSVTRFILIGVAMPLVMFLVARRVFTSPSTVRILLWSIVAASAYSAAVSILQFTAPALVWPRYILSNTIWPGRAVGVFDQPVVNGLVLIVGFCVSALIAWHDQERGFPRLLAAAVAVASACGVYLTYTRAVWVAFLLIVIVGAFAARSFRGPFVLTIAAMAAAVAVGWSALTSPDGGGREVTSLQEVYDRLNTLATSLWAVQERPILGWGIGRFPAVNTHHHRQFSVDVPWERGFGIASHLDVLGILVELGVVGLILWLLVTVLLCTSLGRATRGLPAGQLYGRPLGVSAILCLVAHLATGLTVDLRFFDFSSIMIMMLVGAVVGLQAQQARPPSSTAGAGVRQRTALGTPAG